MKFIKLESFWKDTSAWLVNVNDIIFVEDKGDYRDVTIRVNENNNEHKLVRVTNSIDEIKTSIEIEIELPGIKTNKHLNS